MVRHEGLFIGGGDVVAVVVVSTLHFTLAHGSTAHGGPSRHGNDDVVRSDTIALLAALRARARARHRHDIAAL